MSFTNKLKQVLYIHNTTTLLCSK